MNERGRTVLELLVVLALLLRKFIWWNDEIGGLGRSWRRQNARHG